MKFDYSAFCLGLFVLVASIPAQSDTYRSAPVTSYPASSSEDKAAKYRDIQELFKIQKTKQMGQQISAQLIQSFGQKMPEKQRQQLAAVVHREFNSDDLMKLLIPIYDQIFTRVEIQQLLVFYKTAIGQKLISTQPKIMQESMVAAQQWAKQKLPEIQSAMKTQVNDHSQVPADNQ